ncbi:nuclear transport factor 2 family protein [Mycolicibacillus parakoreensis]|uniref:Nuclear transport factor 2 family protein n=1 Tax=Mycolicibacillus parakoreensis TaxID=1069221 RepID=A0ABY3TYA1_9MYCO|nr:limonene-1,2-epoxide hydrolase family protein [Mycolicibacillus parakoreensis]MCV7316671.1 nuclear transport factor 2 family protein [Mycolicibacillus parakoreensis]ULN51598.1 nuclear transport factor 2 family protein [Mycolicibacillus parakoreensis]HLR99880.1 limonene-1,2-epoxide hydrolase family protein [Mycolicibacillus parakoreensis]
MTDQIPTPLPADHVGRVDALLGALQDQDFDLLAEVLDENVVYQNVGLPTVRGRRAVVSMLRRMQGRIGFEVKTHRAATDGASVLNERTDVLIIGPLRLQFWVCGVFEVHDNRITLWRDYFDMADIFKATVRGLVGAVIPALRPSL